MKIGDLFLALGVDSADFTTTVKKEATKAGQEGAKSLSSAMATGLKVGAVIVGGAFALMSKGALQMEAAQGKFQAATGKSHEAAVNFSKDMNDLVGNANTVGMTFEQLTDLGTKVEQQFGTTGEETKKLTDEIAGFAKVTGQDAVGAAADLEDTLSAYGLSADDAAGFMDKLVASNQKFGTEVGPAALATLRNMSPALQAMGMDLDDGVEILNAFEVAGLDAATAQRGLQTAVKNLKPGQDLDDLIAQIGAIEDPTLRAQKAIEIFGTRAGAGLAQVIQPGMTSLDDFGISAEDAAGHVTQASDDMLTTGDKIKMFTEKAGAALRGLGADFGPVATGLASVVTLAAPFARSIGKMIGDLASSAAVKFGSTTLGTAVGVAMIEAQAAAQQGAAAIQRLVGSVLATQIPMAGAGTTVGTAVGAAFAAAAVFGVGALLTIGWLHAIDEAKNNIRNNPNGVTPEDMFQSRAPMWAAAKIRVAKEMQAIGQGALDAFNAEWDKGIAAGLSPQAALEPARQAGLAIGQATGDAIPEGIQDAVTGSGREELTRYMQGLGVVGADALGRAFVQSKDQIADDIRESVTFAGQAGVAAAAGFKRIGDAAADALEQGIPSVHQAWDDYLKAQKDALDPMKELAWAEARLAGDKLAAGLDSKNPLTRRRAEVMRDNLEAEIAQLKTLMGDDATDASNALANNLDGAAAVRAAVRIANQINAALMRIDTAHQIKINTVGGADVQAQSRAAGGYTPAGWTWIGERGRELVNFDKPGYVVPHNRLGEVGGNGGNNYNVDITINGDADPDEVQRAVRDGITDATGFHFGLRHAGGLAFKPG